MTHTLLHMIFYQPFLIGCLQCLTLNGINLNKIYEADCFRSSRPEVFCKKGVLRNFAKFTGRHLCQSLFLKNFFLDSIKYLKKMSWTSDRIISFKYIIMSWSDMPLIAHIYVHRYVHHCSRFNPYILTGESCCQS